MVGGGLVLLRPLHLCLNFSDLLRCGHGKQGVETN
jgi:hypothetical protein